MECTLCPRQCHAQRTETQGNGYCHVGTLPMVSRAAAHHWEEPCISGTKGSGTIFFSGCTMRCAFCQNAVISHQPNGKMCTAKELATLFQRIASLGVHNINLVNPTHFAPTVLEALALANCSLPVVWNSSGYESVAMVEEASPFVDIFLPDLKFASPQSALSIAHAPDYPQVAKQAIQAMCKATGLPKYDQNGMLLAGTLVRHLVLPMRTHESLQLLDWISTDLPKGTPVSLMCQYTPMNGITIKGLDRKLTAREYDRVVAHMLMLDLPGYTQEKTSATDVYTPTFMDEDSLQYM